MFYLMNKAPGHGIKIVFKEAFPQILMMTDRSFRFATSWMMLRYLASPFASAKIDRKSLARAFSTVKSTCFAIAAAIEAKERALREELAQQPMENEQVEEAIPNPPATESQRPQRVRGKPAWTSDYEVTGIDPGDDTLTHFALFSDCDPTSFEMVVKEPKWREAMAVEISAIERNNTWELCDLPKGQKTIGVKWVYKTKLKENGKVDKYKARLVAKGYKQEFGVDYKEVSAPVARHDTIRLVISMAAQNSWPIFQLDVKSAFLHGDLKEEVFIDQPPGFTEEGNEHKSV
ncbi:hypothetical protein Sjap_025428 [Stephania japonica]|uniref:Reverse transcriptase Ty1/copia-type domain-containing protein n=1 Tax=Stephania japonica TaxID=461633 RepID=A0AAP0HHJ0_9MAGN